MARRFGRRHAGSSRDVGGKGFGQRRGSSVGASALEKDGIRRGDGGEGGRDCGSGGGGRRGGRADEGGLRGGDRSGSDRGRGGGGDGGGIWGKGDGNDWW